MASSKSPKLRSMPAEALQDMPGWFGPILDMLNGYLSDAGNTFDYLLAKVDAKGNDTSVKSPTLLHGWVNYGNSETPAGYFLDSDGNVHLQGLIKDGAALQTAFVLQAGYRPEFNQNFDRSNAVGAYIGINNTGTVTPTVTGVVSLSGIVFKAKR